MKLNLKTIIILSTIIYLSLAPFTYHPDTKLTLYYGSFIKQKVFHIYNYLDRIDQPFPAFHYPPLNYYLLGAEYLLISPLAGSGFQDWITTNSTEAASVPHAARFNLLAKLPLIAALLLSGYLIYKLMLDNLKTSENQANLATTFWLLKKFNDHVKNTPF